MALMQTGNLVYACLGQLGFALLIDAYGAVTPIAICEIFPRHLRCSGVSAAYNITLGVAGGTAPAVATWLIEQTGNPSVPAMYIMASAVYFRYCGSVDSREFERSNFRYSDAPLCSRS
jgi:MHS family proline/betaine transporter-like MFS transporter